MKKFLFFDLDGTIFDFKSAEKGAISATLSAFGVDPTEKMLERYSEINDACWKALERGEISREELIFRRFELLSDEFSLSLIPRDVQDRYAKELGQGHIFIDGAEELLSYLSGRYELYAVTNGNAGVQRSRIKKARLDRFFKNFFISEEVGFAKPDKRFFDKAFSEVEGFDPALSVIIGDSLSSDIKGAENARVASIYYNPDKKENKSAIKPDFEIEKLEEIKDLVERI